MSETIYVLTVLYFVFVVEKVEGNCIVAFINDVFGLDLSKWHNIYVGYRDSMLNAISFKALGFA
jgi:hypothetical protein